MGHFYDLNLEIYHIYVDTYIPFIAKFWVLNDGISYMSRFDNIVDILRTKV